jgi:hypothetical protein
MIAYVEGQYECDECGAYAGTFELCETGEQEWGDDESVCLPAGWTREWANNTYLHYCPECSEELSLGLG